MASGDAAPGIGILGIDHNHVFAMLGHLLGEGCTAHGWWTGGPAVTEAAFREAHGDIPRVAAPEAILDDPRVGLVVISAKPSDRADLAIRAMEAGKDVITDKPGCTTRSELDRLRAAQARTGRIWSVNFSERFEVRAVARAERLMREGAIGQVIQTVNLAPHRHGPAGRPGWFYERAAYGGILCDLGCHQIDQFIHFTGAQEVKIAHAAVRNVAHPDRPGFQDYGEMTLRGDGAHGFVRVDWFTPGALPTWGDGRLFILGTEGTIELRKYTDIGRPHRTDTLYLVNGTENRAIDCRDEPLTYFRRLLADIRDRTETAMPQDHAFRVMALALWAQRIAEGGDDAA